MGGGWWAAAGGRSRRSRWRRGAGLCCAAWFEIDVRARRRQPATFDFDLLASLLASRFSLQNNIVRSGQIMQLHQEDGDDAAAVKQNPS